MMPAPSFACRNIVLDFFWNSGNPVWLDPGSVLGAKQWTPTGWLGWQAGLAELAWQAGLACWLAGLAGQAGWAGLAGLGWLGWLGAELSNVGAIHQFRNSEFSNVEAESFLT